MGKVFIVDGDSSLVPGHIRKVCATRDLANKEAAVLVNILLAEQDLTPDATAETWQARCLDVRKHIADEIGIEMDDLDDSDAGDVMISEEEFIGAPEPVEVSVQPMRLTDGTTDHFVQIKCGDRAMTIHKHKIAGRSEYEVAEIRHVLGQCDKPDILAFETEAPAHA